MAPRSSTETITEPPPPAPSAPAAGKAGVPLDPPRLATSKGWNPLSLTWSERHHETLEKCWARVPDALKKIVVTLAVFAVGLAMSGDWVVILVHMRRQFGIDPIPAGQPATPTVHQFFSTYFKGFGHIWLMSSLVSYGMYFGLGGFLHWYFYVRQRASAKEWKCQPNSWLSPELELHEIKIGSLSLLVTGTFSACLSAFIYNGGWSMVYYNWSDYGYLWAVLQWPAIFLYQDYVTYWLHRIYHTPWLYKNFHKLHHKYKHPTAFSVTAIHPVEVLHIQMTLCLPLFAFPCHWVSFYTIAMYTYYHGIIDHSGINFKAYWWQPWQPDCIFHDNHHQYFHVNFGFNCWFWDKLHATYRRKDRVYTEDTFYGRGKALAEASAAEVAQDLLERTLENPKAYRNDTLEFALSKDEIKSIEKKDS